MVSEKYTRYTFSSSKGCIVHLIIHNGWTISKKWQSACFTYSTNATKIKTTEFCHVASDLHTLMLVVISVYYAWYHNTQSKWKFVYII